MLEATAAPPYGAVNVWDMYDVEEAREIPCGSAGAFFYLLYSPSTNGARLCSFNADVGYADLRLYGPVTDDANGQITVKQSGDDLLVTAKATGGGRVLTKAELDGTSKYSGFEANACLTAEFRLEKVEIEIRFATEESRDGLVARFRELGITGRPLENLCSILGLRRLR